MVLSVAAATLPASAAARVSVRRAPHSFTRIFPNDASTVRDRNQSTGRRVNFRRGVDYPVVGGHLKRRCTSATYSICDAFAELNKLDGFDLQPRVTVPLTGNIRLSSVRDATFFITTDHGRHFVSGLRQVTWDPRAHVLAGISDKFLREGTRYRIRVTNGIRDSRGRRINACGRVCVVPFTTRTASGELVRIRRALDLSLSNPSNAYRLARFPGASSSTGSRRLSLPNVFRSATIVVPSVGGPSGGIVRNDQVNADGTLKPSVVPNLIAPGRSGFFAFGSFLSPRYQYASSSAHTDRQYGHGGGVTDGEIPPVASNRTPRPFGADRLGVIVVTPDPTVHPPPWPTAVYGPGFTRSKFDIFVSADNNADQGIMTVATDPAGHSYGQKSTITVTSGVTKTTFPGYGRGRDLNGDGKISTGLDDGVGPTGHKRVGASELPSHKPLDGVQSGLIQTTVDNLTLGRALKAGLTIPAVSGSTNLVKPDQIYYYGISFGGIYGTMLMGTDPLFHRGLLNVPGGPIADIARISGFRNNLADQVRRSRPNLLNGGPGLNGFTEDLPLRNQPARTITHKGAGVLQELFGESNWFDRSGSPETFAPRLRLRPDAAWAKKPKQLAFQTAYGDGTVPNPTAGTLYRAGALFDRVTYYRNDKTPTFGSDPHGFLADPTLAGRSPGQMQLTNFLATGQVTNPNPAFFEFPIVNRNNLECLHYPDPQTGVAQTRQMFPASGDCPAPPARR
jgi:hypothetical protein